MIKFKTIRNIGLAGLLLFGLYSCNQEDFLETVDKSKLTDATMWETEGNADIYLNDCYGDLPAKSNQPDNLDNFTPDNDAGFYYTSWNWKQGIVRASGYSNGNHSVWFGTNGPGQYEGWNAYYTKIRKLNTFIAKITENKANFSEEWYNKRMDEARFLRSYFYSEGFQELGGMVILTEPQNRTEMTEAEMLLPRSTFEETLDFIVGELTDIVNNGYLEVKYNNGNSDAGRATLGAAQMLKGWLQLFAASPAYNSADPAVPNEASNQDLQSFATPDPGRWADAAATFKDFMETWGHLGDKTYDLFPSMKEFWYEANEYNSEVVWDKQHVGIGIGGGISNTFDTYGGPVWIHGTYYTWGNYCPTQEVVDEYQMANGLDIDDPGSGYDPQDPYVGREQRFYDFIVYDGAEYYQDWMTEPYTLYTRVDKVNPHDNEIDMGRDDVGNTGYYYKKRLDNLHPRGGNQCGMNHVYYRYAEVVLGYAEAQNEAVGPDQSVYDAVNAIRQRPGTDLPPLPAGLSQAEMREAIHHERRIEFVYEHKRLFDLWRWKQAEIDIDGDLHGMYISNTVPADNSGVWTYDVIGLAHPMTFNQEMYFNPIPQSAIDRNPQLKQNWGY
ncbi:MAG TPA: RagB/SusD family nutrient uptake outer membrane protein [Bacteroidales bacterium]|nr:RagB/SusD family nutrient uptake outer membrane protein [Bacteroidales bacterium]HPI68646.1 RagB/SusD family nutrient uptake outer membrane protein [Bacteroidales bacterium]HPR72919.1 RagB/SusD family nutrient uptake outer membrane protein [Bacteroidales bacterium]